MITPHRHAVFQPWHPIKFPDDIIVFLIQLGRKAPWHPIKFPDDIIEVVGVENGNEPWHPIKFPDDIILRSISSPPIFALAPYQIPG